MKRKFNPFHNIREELKKSRATTPGAVGEDFCGEKNYPSSQRLAFLDEDFLLSDAARPSRLQLELLKVEEALSKANIASTIVVFGSARIFPKEKALLALAEAQKDQHKNPSLENEARLKWAQRQVELSHSYEEARQFARLASEHSMQGDNAHYVIMTGGGGGVMEAANRGAHDVGAKTIGLNILLPCEQTANPYLSRDLSFRVHYFAIRKMHFLLRARALVAFPGGFGTLDEVFETLTLLQTKKMQPIPLILVNRSYWEKLINFSMLVEDGYIDKKDVGLFTYVETAEEAWDCIREFYNDSPVMLV